MIGLGVGIDTLARGYALYGLYGRPDVLPGAMAAAWATNFTWILGLGLVPLTLLLFPDGRLLTRRWRPLAWLILFLAVTLPLEGAVSPGPLQFFPDLENPLGVTGGPLGRLVEAFGPVGFQLFLATLPAAAVALGLRFRRARGVERQQLKWFAAAGLVLVAVPVADTIGLIDSNRLIELLSTWPLYLAIGIAILRHRLYDIDRLLNRTLVYGLLTAVLGLGYGGAVLVAGATLAVAALFQPARRRIQAAVDRRFNRRRYNAAATIQGFVTRLRDQVDLDTLSAELLAVVDQTVQPTRASLWLRSPTPRPGRARQARS